MTKLRTVVFPAAGLGTRILPATKAFPKELLPLVDKPIIQYGVEEASNSGLRNVVLVTSPDNLMTSAHFKPNPKLEAVLAKRKNVRSLEIIKRLSNLADVTTVHQKQPLGLGNAVLIAKEKVGDEPFAVVLSDDVIDADPPGLRQMINVFEKVGKSVLLVERVPREAVHHYGIVDATLLQERIYKVHSLVEKPHPDQSPSNLAIVGRYILMPDIFSALDQTEKDAGGEVQLTEGLNQLLKQNHEIYAYELNGIRHDAGTTFGFLKAAIHYALKRPDLEPALREFLKTNINL
jgi:UTP--glucose-1-phosphate uridylyltransferase